MTLLSLDNVSKSFGGLMAVKRLSLGVEEGEVLGLIGPNGSGKTTAFNLITGFLQPDSGRITLRGSDITGFKPPRIGASGIARTFQLVKPFPHLTALQNVMVGRLYGCSPAKTQSQAREECVGILDFVGLVGKHDALAKNLTIVERKRLELARALAARPHLLLLDELMAGLSPTETDGAMELIRAIRKSGVTVIMVEHIIKAVLGLCDRVVVLNAGEKIAEGTAQEIVTNEKVKEAYLGKFSRA